MLKRFGILGLVLGGAMLFQPAATFAEGLHNAPAVHDTARTVREYKNVRVVKSYREPVRQHDARKHKAERRNVRFDRDYRR